MAIITERALRNLIRQTLLQEGVYDPGILKAVFLAGGPGSGKSYTAKGIFGVPRDLKLAAGTASGLRFINSDPAFERELKKMGIDPKTLRAWVRAGKFPQPIAIERTRRWRVADLERFETRAQRKEGAGA